MTIMVKSKTVYGNQMFYPANETASKMAAWKGQKTLTRSDLVAAKDIGFQIEFVVEEVVL